MLLDAFCKKFLLYNELLQRFKKLSGFYFCKIDGAAEDLLAD
jgi:hypothetical protein